jgi:hypothetical protein
MASTVEATVEKTDERTAATAGTSAADRPDRSRADPGE